MNLSATSRPRSVSNAATQNRANRDYLGPVTEQVVLSQILFACWVGRKLASLQDDLLLRQSHQ